MCTKRKKDRKQRQERATELKEEEMDGNEQSGQEKKKVQMCFLKKEQIKNEFRTKYGT